MENRLTETAKASIVDLINVAMRLTEAQQERLLWIGEGILLAGRVNGESDN